MNKDFENFKILLKNLRSSASKIGSYDRLEEWGKPVGDYIHDMLDKYGFVNGDPEKNKENKEVSFWWEIYKIYGSIIYSRFLKSQYANHHSSAWERNEALIKEMDNLN